MKIAILLVSSFLLIAGCASPAGAPTSATPDSPRPTWTPPATATVLPTASWTPSPSPTPLPNLTFTPRPKHAPPLPHVDVRYIFNGSRDTPYVALTFDLCQKPDNPAGFDQGIVDALVKYQVPATFFLGGDWMRTHPKETLILANNPLFELGNHSWSHPNMQELDEAQISQEVLKTQEMMYQLNGRQPRLFRLPAGLSDDLVLSVIAWHGLYTIQWDADTADPVPDNSAGNITKLVRERVKNGSIVLMHANGRGWHTAEALPLIIDYLRGQGYVLVTVPQLIGLDPAPPLTPTGTP